MTEPTEAATISSVRENALADQRRYGAPGDD